MLDSSKARPTAGVAWQLLQAAFPLLFSSHLYSQVWEKIPDSSGKLPALPEQEVPGGFPRRSSSTDTPGAVEEGCSQLKFPQVYGESWQWGLRAEETLAMCPATHPSLSMGPQMPRSACKTPSGQNQGVQGGSKRGWEQGLQTCFSLAKHPDVPSLLSSFHGPSGTCHCPFAHSIPTPPCCSLTVRHSPMAGPWNWLFPLPGRLFLQYPSPNSFSSLFKCHLSEVEPS